MATAYFDIVNSNILVPYSSASNYDMVIRTEGPGQRLFVGNSNGAFVPGLVISSNMVGIGKSNPAYPLDVNGNVSLGSVASNAVGSINAANLGMFRNRVINGDMSLDNTYQGGVRVGQTSGGILDQWTIQENASQPGRMSMNRSAVPATHPMGLQYALKLFITTATATLNNFDYMQIWQNIQGQHLADLNYGTSYTAPITVSFWVYSNKTGTFAFSLTNGNISSSRRYVGSYTVGTANTWQSVSVSLSGDTTTAMPTGTNVGMTLAFNFGVGTGLQTATAGQWITSTSAMSPQSPTNFYDSTANVMYITGVQIEKGSLQTPFEFRAPIVESLLNQNLVLGSVANNTVGNVCAGNLGMYRNRVVNGDMRLFNNTTSSITLGNAGTYYTLADDAWVLYAGTFTSGTLTVARNTLGNSDAAYSSAGHQYSLRITATAGVVGASAVLYAFRTTLYEIDDWRWGTTSGIPVALSFWFKTNVANNSVINVCIVGWNGTTQVCYNTHAIVTNSGAWQYYSLVVPAPPSSTVFPNNATQIIIGGYNANILTSNLNTWEGSAKIGTTTSFAQNLWATTGNYLEITGVQIEAGGMATPFDKRPTTIESAIYNVQSIGATQYPIGTNRWRIGGYGTIGGNAGTNGLVVWRDGVDNPASGTAWAYTPPLTIETNGINVFPVSGFTRNLFKLTVNGGVGPQLDNTNALGSSGSRFTALYAVNGTVQTSDAREKTDVCDSDLGLDFVNALRPVSYRWVVGKNVYDSNNGMRAIEGVRTHYGLIAQEVKEVADRCRNGADFGGWVLSDLQDPESRQGLNYSEFVGPMVKAIQELSAKVERLEAALAAKN